LSGGTPLVSGGAKDLYVMQLSSSGDVASILDFAADSGGSLKPRSTLVPPAGFEVEAIATDSAGQIYLGGINTAATGYEVLIYAPGATGLASPSRTVNLLNDENGQYLPLDMTVDSSGRLYVVGLGVVGVFAANASGDSSALTSFALSYDGPLVGYTGIEVDGFGNMYIAEYIQDTETSVTGQILIYGAGANGNPSPMKRIALTGAPYGLALDASGNIYTPMNTLTFNSSGEVTSSTCQVIEFENLTSESLAEAKTIAGAATGVTLGSGSQIDEAGNLYLVSTSNATVGPEVVGFAPTASGNVAPGIVFTSSSWTDTSTQMALH
jgi:hypothetical protein